MVQELHGSCLELSPRIVFHESLDVIGKEVEHDLERFFCLRLAFLLLHDLAGKGAAVLNQSK